MFPLVPFLMKRKCCFQQQTSSPTLTSGDSKLEVKLRSRASLELLSLSIAASLGVSTAFNALAASRLCGVDELSNTPASLASARVASIACIFLAFCTLFPTPCGPLASPFSAVESYCKSIGRRYLLQGIKDGYQNLLANGRLDQPCKLRLNIEIDKGALDSLCLPTTSTYHITPAFSRACCNSCEADS